MWLPLYSRRFFRSVSLRISPSLALQQTCRHREVHDTHCTPRRRISLHAFCAENPAVAASAHTALAETRPNPPAVPRRTRARTSAETASRSLLRPPPTIREEVL